MTALESATAPRAAAGGVRDATRFAADRSAMVAVEQATTAAQAALAAARNLACSAQRALAARQEPRCVAIEMLPGASRAEAAAEAQRAEARELDEVATQLWQRRNRLGVVS